METGAIAVMTKAAVRCYLTAKGAIIIYYKYITLYTYTRCTMKRTGCGGATTDGEVGSRRGGRKGEESKADVGRF